jgi:hypothetical protein
MMLSRQGPNENGNAQRRYRVLPLTLDTGEVLPTLVDSVSVWIPVRVATRWVVRRRRWRSMPSTLANDLRSIGLVYSWASSALEGDLDDLLEDGQPITGMQDRGPARIPEGRRPCRRYQSRDNLRQ